MNQPKTTNQPSDQINKSSDKVAMKWREEVGVVESHLSAYQSGDPLLHFFPTSTSSNNMK